ncbi:la-related protein 4-like isoform X1 [Haliotis cracherodii]|uniref:la-related protein 4-like isoform X1 n=1 Tax=Haliotis cracherodii TaxID=6455 RepID=UPI0039EA47D1
MLPGDVYYYSANSCVLCVKRGQSTKRVTPKSPGPGLNPNANVFLSSKSPASPDSTTQWDSPGSDTAYQGQPNGDVKLEQPSVVGVGSGSGSTSSTGSGPTFPTADSPVSVTDYTATANFNDNQNALTNDNASVASTEDGSMPLEGSIPEDQLRQLLQTQLEYYFSRENLVHDTYLQSQMDPDQYVAIATVANFNQVQKLTNNLQLIVDVLRRSPSVQVDEKGEKVRPNHSRCVVILREIPDTTPVEDVQQLFKGENCPPFVNCEFAHNNSWYVTFESDEDAQRAYQFLREEVRTFLDRPIMARIKAKPLIRSTFVPRNGMKVPFQGTAEQPTYPIPQPQQQQPQQQQAQQQPYRMVQPASVQYIGNGQQPFPFYPLSPTVMSPWAPSATPFLDPGAVSKYKMFQMNGYQATSIKPTASTNRHIFQSNARTNSRNMKTHRSSVQERNNSEGRMTNERHSVSAPRTSPRSLDSAQISSFTRRGDMGGNSHMVNASVQPHGVDANANLTQNNKSDMVSQRKSYKRGRRGEEGAKNSRQNPSMPGRDGRLEPQFELESTSFPPLPGSLNNAASNESFESKLSDVVKGTARLQVREPSTTKSVQQPQSTAPPPSSSSQHTASRVASPPPQPVATPPSPTVVAPPPAPVVAPVTPAVKEVLEPTAVPVTTATATVAVTAEPVYQQKSSKAASAAETKPAPEPTVTKQASVVVSSQSKPTTSSVSVLLQEEKPNLPPGVKLSYAQMVQRKRDTDGNGGEKTKEDNNTSPQQSPPPVTTAVTSAKNGQTLREQTQTVKVASASARQPQMKDNVRKDFEPKEQRPQRRAKENRERRDRRRDRSEREIKVAAK